MSLDLVDLFKISTVAENVLSHLSANDLAKFSFCCRKFREIVNSNCLWNKICIRNQFEKYEYLLNLPTDSETLKMSIKTSPTFNQIGWIPFL
jgi:hypothetical protein